MAQKLAVKSKDYMAVYTCVSRSSYWVVEREAHARALDLLAFKKNKRVPYMVKMSVYAPPVDRNQEFLEDNFRRSVIQADVVVFEDLKQQKSFEDRGLMVYTQYD